MYMKVSARETAARDEEKRIEAEWERLQSLQEELAECARALKGKEEQMRKLEGEEEIRSPDSPDAS